MLTLLTLTSAFATDVVLTPSDDRTIRRTGWISGNDQLFTGIAPNNTREMHTIVRFDLLGPPVGETLVGGTLELTVLGGTSAGPQVINVMRITEQWNEVDANWVYSDRPVRWTDLGGTFDPVPVASFTVDGPGAYSVDLPLSYVQDLTEGNFANYGLLLDHDDNGGQVEFESKEVGGSTMVLSYTDGAPPDNVDAAVADMADMANAAFGSTIITEASDTVAARPSSLESYFRRLLSELKAQGCVVEADVQGYVAGSYASASGTLTGDYDDGVLTGGAVTLDPKSFTATLDGTGEVFGGVFSDFNASRQVVADLDGDGFVAGRIVRVAGTNGVFLALTGTCDAGGDAPTALSDWYNGDLSGWLLP